MWVGIKGVLRKQAEEADTGITTLKAQKGKMVSRSEAEREALLQYVLLEHYRKLKTPIANETFDADFEKEIHAWAEGERRCIRKGTQPGVQKRYRESSQGKK